MRALGRGGNLRREFGIIEGPFRNPRAAVREMGIDVFAGQADTEIGRRDSFGAIVAKDAIEQEIAGSEPVMRELPVPVHGCQIAGGRYGLARNAIGVTEIP